jgi:hypothetical protein
VSNSPTADQRAEPPSHPAWCDANRCTKGERGGAHYSAWFTLNPFSNRVVVRAYLFSESCVSPATVMVAAYSPLDYPEDIAANAGHIEDTVGAIVMGAEELAQLIELLSSLLAASREPVKSSSPEEGVGVQGLER